MWLIGLFLALGVVLGPLVPAIYASREFVDAGGLFAYGAKQSELYRRAASYVDKILKGAKPADLPVGQPTTYELVVNMKTAKVLGLTIPQSVLLRADQVIEERLAPARANHAEVGRVPRVATRTM